MVKGYQFKCDYGDGCGMKEYKSHEHLGADYVLATNYAALEAERDEWKRRCEAIVTELVPKPSPPNPTNPTAVDVAIWRESRSIHRRIERIAEGRDNG